MTDPYASPFGEQTPPERAAWREIILAGWSIPIRDTFQTVQLARWAPKVTQGDYTLDSDDLISADIKSDFTGGGQINRHRTAGTTQRFWDATNLDTEHPQLLALRTMTYATTGPNTDAAMPLGDYPGRDHFWASFGSTISQWNPMTLAWTAGTSLGAIPSGKGVEYKGYLWIPCSASGIVKWNGTVATLDAAITAVSLILWDNKLLALTAAGELRIYDGTSWSAADPNLTLPASKVPRSLVLFRDPSGNPAVYLVTDEDLWVYDPLIPKIYRTDVQFPYHPDHALAAEKWRSTDMYIAVGVGVHLYNGSVVSAMGLDRNDGLPANLRGAIVDFADEYNGLMALVRGEQSEEGASSTIIMDETMVYDDPAVMPERHTVSSLHRYNGQGWHKVWQSTDAAGLPTKVMVSRADSQYELWWGYAGKMYRHPLRRTFHNPEQGAEAGIDTFVPSGNLLTGTTAHGMEGFEKLASHVVVMANEQHVGQVEYWWQTDRRGWTQLGTVDAPGVHVLPFDPDGDGFAEGDPYGWIEFDYRFRQTGGVTTTPLIQSSTEKFIKLAHPVESWTFDVPLDFPESWKGRGPQEIADFLDELTSDANPRFHKLVIGDRTFRVRVAQAQGTSASGSDRRSLRKLNILEVPLQ